MQKHQSESVFYQILIVHFLILQTKERNISKILCRSLRLEPFPEFINLLQMNLQQVIKTFQFVLVINVNDQVTA
jgi:hypothetical protein